MKKTLFAIAVCAFAACVPARAAHRTETTVRPTGEAHQYEVTFKIIEVSQDGKTDVLSAPKIIVMAGHDAQVKTADEKEKNGVFCRVLVKETNEGVEAATTVVVKENGAEKSNTTQILTIGR